MSNVIETLVEMGFSKEKAELAVTKTQNGDVTACMDWLLAHNDEETAEEPPTTAPTEESSAGESPGAAAKSLKCDECGKLFKSQDDVEYHASKTGHENFSESVEEKKPLSEEEKKEQLARIEAKLRQRRLEREAKEKQEALDKEKNRIRTGKEMLEAKKKHEELEMKKVVEQKRREKEEERMARQRVREQIEQDKLARKAKFSPQQQQQQQQQQEPETPKTPPVTSAAPIPAPKYNEVQLQIRLTNGKSLVQTFGAKEPLSAVRLYIELNREDGSGPFSLMLPFPRKVFGPEDYDVPLETLGLGPRATLIVSKS